MFSPCPCQVRKGTYWDVQECGSQCEGAFHLCIPQIDRRREGSCQASPFNQIKVKTKFFNSYPAFVYLGSEEIECLLKVMGKILRIKKRLADSKDGKTVLANFGYLSLLQIAGSVFPLITMPYLARVVGAEGFGKIEFAAAR